jgi:DNA-binding response OmpR family regulator
MVPPRKGSFSMTQARSNSAGNVLIADDDADIRALVLLALRNAGFRAETVDGGVEALAAARREKHEVLVLDVRMPDMSGLEVCRQVKAEAADSHVLMISANSSSEDVAAGYAAGADDYLPKPFSPRELVQRVALLVGREGAQTSRQT